MMELYTSIMFDIFWMNVAAVFALVNVIFVGAPHLRLHPELEEGAVQLHSQPYCLRRRSSSSRTRDNRLLVRALHHRLEPVVEAAAPYLTAVNAAEAMGLGMLTRTTWK